MKVAFTQLTTNQLKVDVTFDSTVEMSPQSWRVDWGDGTPVTVVASGTLTTNHQYAKAGPARVKVSSNDVSFEQFVQIGSPEPLARGGAVARQRRVIQEDLAVQRATTSRIG